MTGVTRGICDGKDTKRRYFAEDVRYALIRAENGGLVRAMRASDSSLLRDLAEAPVSLKQEWSKRKKAASSSGPHFPAQCAAVGKTIAWEMIEARLGSKTPKKAIWRKSRIPMILRTESAVCAPALLNDRTWYLAGCASRKERNLSRSGLAS
jgi:hypothetical protein